MENNVIALDSDLDLSCGIRAHSGMSFSPEKRAQSDIDDYVAAVNSLFNELLAKAETDDQRVVAREQAERYKAKYIEHRNTMWGAYSRCMSAMIAGPANFPVARNRKRMDTYDKRVSEFLEWNEKARVAAHRAISAARSPEQVADAEWAALKRDIDWSMEHRFNTNIQGKLERRAANGEVDLIKKALDHIREVQSTWKRPFFSARNRVWTLVEVAQAAAEKLGAKAANPGEDQVILEVSGIRVINNRAAERIQIFFDGKPAPDMIARLKGSAWKWSPSNGCWQRQNTLNAVYNVNYVLSEFLPKKAA